MGNITQFIVSIVGALLASTGFWAFIASRKEKGTAQDEMLIGLAHDRIIGLGMSYINRGWISSDEYENLCEYLYKPYCKLGGNGSAKRIMSEVDKLPIKPH